MIILFGGRKNNIKAIGVISLLPFLLDSFCQKLFLKYTLRGNILLVNNSNIKYK